MIIKAVKHLPDYQPKPSEKLIRGNDGRVIVFNLLLGEGEVKHLYSYPPHSKSILGNNKRKKY
jgi:hypothetical protein